MFRGMTAGIVAGLMMAQPALAQDLATAVPTGPAPAAAAPARHMSFAEKLAIAAGVIGAGVVAVKALKGGGQSGPTGPAAAAPAGTVQSAAMPAAN